MRPEELASAAAESTPAAATGKPRAKKPPAAPLGLTSPASNAASGKGRDSGNSAPAVPPQVTDELGMMTGALSPAVESMFDDGNSTFNSFFGAVADSAEPLGPTTPVSTPPIPQWGGSAVQLGSNVHAMGASGVVNTGPHMQGPSEATLERTEREKSLPQGGKQKYGKLRKKVEPMTVEEYSALSNTQKAAVDFNTMLVQAVGRDKKMQDTYDPSTDQSRNYNASVKHMFGTNGGSDLYAPETMAVLKQINFKDSAADLDDFLGLKTAIKTKDLKQIEEVADMPEIFGVKVGSGNVDELTNLQHTLAEKTAGVEEALTASGVLLQSTPALLRAVRNDVGDVQRWGGLQKPVNAGLGYNPADKSKMDATLQMVYQELSTLGDKAPARLEEILKVAGPQDSKVLMQYLDTRSLQSERFNINIEGWTTPAEFRKLLGLSEESTNGS